MLLATYAMWTVPLAALQRTLWHARWSWMAIGMVVLATSYVMSLGSNALALALALHWRAVASFEWSLVFSRLEGDWLALVSFGAMYAVLLYHQALGAAVLEAAEAGVHARDAELRALRYQMHPHFLFNTLNAASSLVASGRNVEANRVLARLGDFLRATLDAGPGHECSFAEELTLTKSYLDIEKARMGDRLTLRMNIGPGIMAARVPRLLLQPLVENAVRHGVGPREGGGRLDIDAERQGAVLSVKVTNDKTGSLTPEKQRDAPSIGLPNLRARLQALYPGSHRLAIEHEGTMFSVSITLPFVVDTPADAMASGT